MSDLANMVRFSIKPEADSWRWETFDLGGARRAGGLARSRSIAAAMVIRDICSAQASEPADHLMLAPSLGRKAA